MSTGPSSQAAISATAAPTAPVLPAVRFVWLKGAVIAGFLALCAWLAVQVVQGGVDLGLLWWSPVVAVSGYVVADFVSGFVHFLADNFAEAETPLIGKTFVKPFRDHHVDPLGITRHDFVETNINNVIVSLPFIVPAALLLPVGTSTLGWFTGTFALCFILAIFLTNQFHKWAHEPHPPAIALRLQRAGLILSKEHHDVHHTSPFDTHYCITVGLWNKFLERIHLWEKLERGIRRWVPGTDPRTRVEQEAAARRTERTAQGTH